MKRGSRPAAPRPLLCFSPVISPPTENTWFAEREGGLNPPHSSATGSASRVTSWRMAGENMRSSSSIRQLATTEALLLRCWRCCWRWRRWRRLSRSRSPSSRATPAPASSCGVRLLLRSRSGRPSRLLVPDGTRPGRRRADEYRHHQEDDKERRSAKLFVVVHARQSACSEVLRIARRAEESWRFLWKVSPSAGRSHLARRPTASRRWLGTRRRRSWRC